MNDLQVEVLKRGGYLSPDFKLKADYGGPKTTLEGVQEFFQDLPSNLTFGLIPKANPFGRMTADEIRQVDASRGADLQQALEKQTEAQTEERKEKESKTDAENFDTSLNRSIQQALAEGAIAKDILKTAGQISTDQSVAQAQALLPIIDQASARGLSRNLAASKDFLAFKQQQPLAQQAIMASKQQQMTGAADAFLKEAMAIATQQQAANQFGSLGTGRRFG